MDKMQGIVEHTKCKLVWSLDTIPVLTDWILVVKQPCLNCGNGDFLYKIVLYLFYVKWILWNEIEQCNVVNCFNFMAFKFWNSYNGEILCI